MKNPTKNEAGSTPSDNELNELIAEIIEQLRTQNRIHAIAVEALLDKKIEQDKVNQT